MEKNTTTQGHLAAFITIFIWGTTFVSIKVLLDDFSPTEVFFFRILIAYFALLLVSPHFIKYKNLKEELLFMAAGLCGVTLYFIFQNTALSYTLASNVGVLLAIAPFFTAIVSHFFLKDEELRPNFFIGFVVSIIGVVLISFNGNFILKLNPLGDILSILSAVVWAFYSVIMRKISAFQYNTIQTTRKVFFYGFLFLLPLLPFFGFRLDLARFSDSSNLLNMLFLALGASALCFVTWNFAVSVLGAIKTSVYIYMTPVVSILTSAIVIHERITGLALLGVVLILSGLYLSSGERKTQVSWVKANLYYYTSWFTYCYIC